MASNQRTARSNDLNKPSVQSSPFQARRPATLGTSTSAAKPGLKARSSLSSIMDRKDAGPEETSDKSKTAMNGSAKRASVPGPPRSISPTKASLGRRSVLASTTNIEKKPTTDRSSTVSPLKSALKNIGSSPRPAKPSVTPRSTRPIGYSPQSSSTKKRLSSITASPASAREESPSQAATNQQTPTVAKARRPELPTRKSTMSVTIEQRLREMELVNTMLRAAMAEDGEEDDEVKEKYGEQADEELAKLRSKLEEARRNECKLALSGNEIRQNEHEVVVVESPSSNAALEIKCVESQRETSRLRSELSSLRQQLADIRGSEIGGTRSITAEGCIYHAEDHDSELEKIKALYAQNLANLQYKFDIAQAALQDKMKGYPKTLEEAKASHAQELTAALQKLDATQVVEAALQDKVKGHPKALEEAIASNTQELAILQDRFDAAQAELQEARKDHTESLEAAKIRATRLLDNQLQHHEAELGSFRQDLNQERQLRREAIVKQEQRGYEVLDLKNKADDDRVKFEQELNKAYLARVEASTKCEQLRQELLDVKHKSDEERARLMRCLEKLEGDHAELSIQMEHMKSCKDTAYDQLMNEMHSSQVRKDQQAAAAMDSQTAAFGSQLKNCISTIYDLEHAMASLKRDYDLRSSTSLHQIQDLEITARQTAVERDAVVQNKSEEVKILQDVIGSLQDTVRDVHERKDRELETQRFQLSQEHDETLSKLRFEYEEELDKEKNTGTKDTSALVHRHGQEMASCREESQKTIELLKMQLEDLQDSANEEVKRQTQEYQQALEVSEIEHEDTKSAVLEAKELIEILGTRLEEAQAECEKAKADSTESRDRFQRKDDECTDLTHRLAWHEKDQRNATQDHVATVSRMREELEASTQALEKKDVQLGAAIECHEAIERELESEHSRETAELKTAVKHLNWVNFELLSCTNHSHEKRIADLKALHEEKVSASVRELRDIKTQFALEIEALRKADVQQRDQNTILQQQLQQALEVAELRAMRLREAESALKVTKAELVELQTKRPNSSPFATSTPLPKSSYRSSLWAVDENTARRAEDLGPSISGNMAGMKEQVRQLKDLNEDMISDQERLCKKMSSLHSPDPLRWLDSTMEEEDEL